nr:MAG TPA: hypothetical protein [Caudoviricetes sp.]
MGLIQLPAIMMKTSLLKKCELLQILWLLFGYRDKLHQ